MNFTLHPRYEPKDQITPEERAAIDNHIAVYGVTKCKPGEESGPIERVVIARDKARQNSKKLAARQMCSAAYSRKRVALSGIKL